VKRLALRGRVTLASAAALGIGVALLGLAINLLLSSALNSDASSVLRDRADAQLATLDTSHGRVRFAELARDDGQLDRQSWLFAGRRAVERPPAPQRVQHAAQRLTAVARPTERQVGESVRLRAEPAYRGADRRRRVATVVVGVSLLPYEHTERIALLGTIALGLFVLLAGTLLARRAVAAALRPVGDMTDRASEWSERDLHRRFGLGPPRDELTRLAATLDGLLGRIDAALRHEQRFSAEMAHELRTPLTSVRAEAELALRAGSSPDDLREGMRSVLAATGRMEAAIQTLLTTARSGSAGGPGSCDPSVPLSEVAGSMRQAAAAHGVVVEVCAPRNATTVRAADDVVAQALHPLLDNAIHHAASRVTVGVEEKDGVVVISVGDDGPGVGSDRAEQLFQAGASSTGGAGLGLPLARRLARSCGGDVQLSAANGATSFELRLPGSAPSSA
jgi:two-component system OmpR family sensor kinase